MLYSTALCQINSKASRLSLTMEKMTVLGSSVARVVQIVFCVASGATQLPLLRTMNVGP